jgi:hypothetical protein
MSLPEPIPPTSAERYANRIIRQTTIKDPMIDIKMCDIGCLNPTEKTHLVGFLKHKSRILKLTEKLASTTQIADKLRIIDKINALSADMERSGHEELINLEVGNKVHRMKVYRFPKAKR